MTGNSAIFEGESQELAAFTQYYRKDLGVCGKWCAAGA